MHTLDWMPRLPYRSGPSFALLPRIVAQNRRKMVLGRQVRLLCHVILQDKDGLMLLQLLKHNLTLECDKKYGKLCMINDH